MRQLNPMLKIWARRCSAARLQSSIGFVRQQRSVKFGSTLPLCLIICCGTSGLRRTKFTASGPASGSRRAHGLSDWASGTFSIFDQRQRRPTGEAPMVDQREAMRPVGGNDVLRLPDEQTGKDDYATWLNGPRHVLRECDERIGKDI